MALIEFKNLPDRTTPINAENLNNNFSELETLSRPVVLFNSSGTFLDVTLNDNCSNYYKFTIYGIDSRSGFACSFDVLYNGENVNFNIGMPIDRTGYNEFYVFAKIMYFSEKTIKINTSYPTRTIKWGYYDMTPTWNDNNFNDFKITKVIGYKNESASGKMATQSVQSTPAMMSLDNTSSTNELTENVVEETIVKKTGSFKPTNTNETIEEIDKEEE